MQKGEEEELLVQLGLLDPIAAEGAPPSFLP